VSWDIRRADWKQIRRIVSNTRTSAKELQHALKNTDIQARAEALTEHASKIAGCLIGVPILEVPEWAWSIAKVVAAARDVHEEYVEAAQEVTHDVPLVYAAFRRKLVVNTVTNAGSELLKLNL
jgi:hypothetical protein